MRTLLTALFITLYASVSAQYNFNGFTSDFRYYDGKKPTCYTPTVNNLNGHLMGINRELCRLDSLLQFIEADTVTTAFIQAQIDSIAALIYEIDVLSTDTTVTVNRTDNTFDLSYDWSYGSPSCYETVVNVIYPSEYVYDDSSGISLYAIYCTKNANILFYNPLITYGTIQPKELIDTIFEYFTQSDSIYLDRTSDTSFNVIFENTCDCDSLVFISETESVYVTLIGEGDTVNNQTFESGGFGSYITFYQGNCIGSTQLDSILQYLINYYCVTPVDTCCGDTVINNSYQVITGIGIFDMSGFLSDTNCFASTRHTVSFNGNNIIDTVRATINDVEFGAWTEGDTLFATTCIRVATKQLTPCDTICRTDTIIVASSNPPTTIVTDYIEINRNQCDTSFATANDIIPCGLASISILSYTSGIDTAYLIDSNIYICRNNFAFENDTVTYTITSNCGSSASDTGIVIVSSVLQPQLALSICYDSLTGLADSALISYVLTVPSGYTLRSNSIMFQATDNSGAYTEYGYGLGGTSKIAYNATDAGLDSATITAYVVIESNFTGLPIFYEIDIPKLASGGCDTLTNIDTTGTVSFWYADSVNACFQYIGYQTGGVNLNVSSGVLYRTQLNLTGITSGINLDSVIFVVDNVASPCSDDSTYQYIIEDVPPYTLTNLDGNAVSVTTGVSVSFGSSSINVNAGGAISLLSSIGLCTVQEYTTTWTFGWKARLNAYTFSFNGLNYSGQCINLQGIIMP